MHLSRISFTRHSRPRRIGVQLSALALLGALCAAQAHAAIVVGFLSDKNGQAVPNAVLYATPLDAPLPPPKAVNPLVVAQENYNFVPYVSVMRVGTSVRFPNRDPHDHHLKSFSPAKSFELRVYSKREEPAPIPFDTVGEVALVCHLHDSMRGFIYVVDTPYFAKSDKAGNALLQNLPAGKYEIKAWAPSMLVGPPPQVVQVTDSGSNSLKFQFNFVPKAPPPPRPPAAPKMDSYY